MRRVHAVTDGTRETVESDLSAMPRPVARSLVHQLAEGERIVIRTRQHPVSLWRAARWPAGALAVYVWFEQGARAGQGLLTAALAVFGLALLYFGWAELTRRFRWIVVTNKRILIHQGFITRAVPMMRLTKVTDMTYRRSILGELTGFGTIIIESAGQQQAIRELTYLPDPDDVNAALNAVIFEEKPRERRRRKQRLGSRPWRGRRGPQTPPDDDGPGGPPRGRGPGPRDNDPGGAGGGVDVSPAGHPPMPRSSPETWYRSSNLRPPRLLGDTGEIPVVRAEDLRVDTDRGDDVRAIPLYPPREWVDEQR